MQQFIEVVFLFTSKEANAEILLAELSQLGFDSFWEDEGKLTGYISRENFDRQMRERIDILVKGLATYTYGEMQDINWNEEWEKNYSPVDIEGRCYLRATFHPAVHGYEYQLVVEPKMSFGTGHHDTTYLMIKHMLDMDFKGKSVFDIGTGTGVLALFAALKGAGRVLAIDNSPWSAENTQENAERNGLEGRIDVREAEIQFIAAEKFDVLLANINRNVILQDLAVYSTFMHAHSTLLLSGIMEHDEEIVKNAAQALDLRLMASDKRGAWCLLCYSKPSDE
jgi:ribosomal protein L11 methyltransferase